MNFCDKPRTRTHTWLSKYGKIWMRGIFLPLYVCICVPKCISHHTKPLWIASGTKSIIPGRRGAGQVVVKYDEPNLRGIKLSIPRVMFFSHSSTSLERPLRPLLFVLRRPSPVGIRIVRICRWIKLCVSIALSVQSLYRAIRYHFKNG